MIPSQGTKIPRAMRPGEKREVTDFRDCKMSYSADGPWKLGWIDRTVNTGRG